MKCTCWKLSVGESREWNELCAEHGVGTHWYTTIGHAAHEARWEQTRRLQLLALEARRKDRLRVTDHGSAQHKADWPDCPVCE